MRRSGALAARAAAAAADAASASDSALAAVCGPSTSGRGCATAPRFHSLHTGDPGRQAAAQQLQRLNLQAFRPGQTVLAKVVQLRPHAVLVDPGFHGLTYVGRKELGTTEVFDAAGLPVNMEARLAEEAAASSREGQQQGQQQQQQQQAAAGGQQAAAGAGGGAAARARPIRVGDHLKLRVNALFTPYGDMQLDPVTVDPAVRGCARPPPRAAPGVTE
jgi:hypothetical protein